MFYLCRPLYLRKKRAANGIKSPLLEYMDLEPIEVAENSVVGTVETSDTSVAHSLMEQQIVITQAQPEAVQVQQVDTQASSEIQVEPEVHIQLQPEFQTEVQVLNLPQHGAGLQSLVQQSMAQKRAADQIDDEQG